jgi:hypothetical protein
MKAYDIVTRLENTEVRIHHFGRGIVVAKNGYPVSLQKNPQEQRKSAQSQ